MSAARDILKTASDAQRRAADPLRNAFVSANAGSGKTKVLVDRVIALLLAGAAPDRIVCLTYTKAAASEMRARLFQRLGGWAVADDDTLAGELAKAGVRSGVSHGGEEGLPMARARALFAQALETPGGLKIQTIHAFCERILRRFPLEAGLDPAFEVMDEAAARRLAAQAAAQGADGALSGADPDLARAYAEIAAAASESAADGLLRWMQAGASALGETFAQGGGLDGLVAQLSAVLDAPADADPSLVKAHAWTATARDRAEAAAHALAAGGKTDQKRAQILFEALKTENAAAAFDVYLSAFFTQGGEGTPVKRLITADTAASAPMAAAFLDSEVARLEHARDQARAAAVSILSAAALTIADRFARAYEQLKRRAGHVDFADLITRTAALVSRADAAQWVLYKLDGGMEHILVDEAQDTAPEQWALIEALSAEFTAGAGGREAEAPTRTIFAVGDEKQSIYGFQGAAPEMFLEAGQRVERQDPQRYTGPALTVSFRSAPAVLEAVDAVFAPTGVAGALTPLGEIPHHQAARQDVRGCVQVWPLIPAPQSVDDADPWAPVDAAPPAHQDEVLARTLAQTIADWLMAGEAVSARDADGVWRPRAMNAGDVMILLRRRSGVFDRIIRALKAAGVPVAGADRLVLSQHVGVQDVLGAARAALLPEDDLALAEWLKSPLLHPVDAPHPPLDDEALFAIAYGRSGRLCAALAQSEDPRFTEARDLLQELRAHAREDGPYAFFAGLLDRASATGETFAERLAHRLGPETIDPLRELLASALAHEGGPAPSLERFVREALFDAADIKREDARGRAEVRVMTVHGAKGLEAPVVILADAADNGAKRQARLDDGVFPNAECGLLWSPRKPADPPAAAARREARAEAAAAEDLRLLYVAMTRAQDRLVICGADGRDRGDEASWWGRAATGLTLLGADEMAGPAAAQGATGLCWGALPDRLGAMRPEGAAPAMTAIPVWAGEPVAAPAPVARRVAPSSLVLDPHPVASPLSDRGASSGARRFQRGRWIHRLLEVLPELPTDARADAAMRLLTAEGAPADAHDILLGEVTRILEDPAFAPVFGPGSRAEVPVIGPVGGALVDGRIDRLAVTDEAVLIVDFKTDRPPPEDVHAVGAPYLAQLAAYRSVMAAIHPRKPVRCALLWTYTAALMPVPDALLDDAPALSSTIG